MDIFHDKVGQRAEDGQKGRYIQYLPGSNHGPLGIFDGAADVLIASHFFLPLIVQSTKCNIQIKYNIINKNKTIINMDSQTIVKTPVQLQLQKINLINLTQFKNTQIQYHLLRILNEILIKDNELVGRSVFHRIFNQLHNFEEMDNIRMLPLYQKFCYQLWNNQNFAIEIREKTSFYRIISNWIVNFELRSGKLDTIYNQFELVLNFMQKQTKTIMERLVMMEEIFQDLKELISEQFWHEEEEIKVEAALGRFKNQLKEGEKGEMKASCSQTELNTIHIIFQLVQAIMNPHFHRLTPKNTLFKNCTYGDATFNNVKQFIKRCIYFILKQKRMPAHMETQLTRISIIFMQFLSQEQSAQILNLIRHLMLKTSKSVRFAMVVQYVQFYEYLEQMGFEEVIEELESMVYFRQLIIGKKIVEESIMEIGNNINFVNLSYHELYIKAGTNKKIFFSNQLEDCVLKLDIIVEQNDINMKICYLDNITLESKSANLKRFIFETVEKINCYDGTKIQPEKVYWQEEKSTSKKLEIKLQYQGLYWLQFDNSYSWVIPKNIKYRLELYQPIS